MNKKFTLIVSINIIFLVGLGVFNYIYINNLNEADNTKQRYEAYFLGSLNESMKLVEDYSSGGFNEEEEKYLLDIESILMDNFYLISPAIDNQSEELYSEIRSTYYDFLEEYESIIEQRNEVSDEEIEELKNRYNELEKLAQEL